MALAPITPSGVSTAFIYPRDTAGGSGIDVAVDADPGSTNQPIIFEPSCDLTGNRLEVWIVASGALPGWGGCEVWASVEVAANYGLLGQISARGTQGILTAPFASGSDPDTSNTLSVDLSESLTTLMPGTMLDADKHITICYCDGELVAYSTATLTSAYNYDLDTYIRRGLYGTTIGSHAAGAQFARLTPAVFRTVFPPDLIGTTFYFKFPAFNTLGFREQDLSNVMVYPYTLTGFGLCKGFKVRRIPQGSTATISQTSDYLLEIVTGSLANTTINGPTGTRFAGERYELKDKNNNAGTYPVSFIPHSPETVEGAATFDMNTSDGAAVLTWDGIEWSVS